jgi:hypothetical protein
MLWSTSSVAVRCCCVTSVIWRADSVVESASLRPSSAAITELEPNWPTSESSDFTSCTEAVTRSASRRISFATSEKARPASPARVPSSDALSARRSLRSAMSRITSRISAMRLV